MFLLLFARPEHLVQAEHCIIGRMVRVMAGWPELRGSRVTNGVIIGNRDCLVMRDQKAELRPGCRTPRMDTRDCAWPFQPYSRLATGVMPVPVFREPGLMRAPAQFRGLETFGNETLYRPGVHKDIPWARLAARLRVALRDVHGLHTKRLHQLGPSRAILWRSGIAPRVRGQRQQRLFYKPRHHAGVCTTATHRRCPTRIGSLFVAHSLTQRVIRALCVICRVKVKPRPGFHNGINVKNTDLAAELHQIQRRRVDT